ncbi:MAG: HD domain-containing phosphohydrolase [Desulfopila sp.]
MKERKKYPQYRILAMISVVFTALAVVFGLFFQQFIYWQTANLLFNESKRIFAQVNQELSQSYRATSDIIGQTVQMVAATGICTATTREQRLAYLPVMKVALDREPSLTSLEIGYANGDFFLIRSVVNEYMRSQFHAPAKARYMVDSIARLSPTSTTMERIWLDHDLTLLQESVPQTTSYDPRLRPWYIEAINSDREIVTEPYPFHFVEQMGITIALMADDAEAVVAGDVLLYRLSQTLAEHRLTPRTELILLAKQDDDYLVVAYQDPDSILTKPNERTRPRKASEFSAPIVRFAASQPDILTPFSRFTLDGETWLGSTGKLELQQEKNLYLVMLAPEEELLLEARWIREQSLKYSALMFLLAIPLIYLLARKISLPIRRLANASQRIGRFEFYLERHSPSSITEVDELSKAMTMMEGTIGQFLSLIRNLAGEHDLDRLLDLITRETMAATKAKAAMAFIVNDAAGLLRPRSFEASVACEEAARAFSALPDYPTDGGELASFLSAGKRKIVATDGLQQLRAVIAPLGLNRPQAFLQPLITRQGERIGLLCLIFAEADAIGSYQQQGRRAFIEALSGFAAVTLESRKMLRMQKNLLDSFIKLLAGAIDSKSPSTGGHCQRVPILTEMLAQKACEASAGPFADFQLNDDEWEAVRIASWLHDCGKMTTPDSVVDKATKLETLYDRIHEIRMRFEVVKREAEVRCWQEIAGGHDRPAALAALEEEWSRLDEEFAFVAACNVGGESMDQEKIDRLERIASRRWLRTLDDRIGISWEEGQRKMRTAAAPLPVQEPILADRPDHIHLRNEDRRAASAGISDLKMEVPEFLYNKGELYNLSIARGTLTPEERYTIKDHIVETIVMLTQLPYPKHLATVPEIAGCHHEKVDGTGYPRKLRGTEMSIPAKMLAIADVFEALTAADRPYKEAKPISEAIAILWQMARNRHIDSDLFRLFLTSGVYLQYARTYLLPEQIDEVDISLYLDPPE